MWKKDSWKDYEALHLPNYEDANQLKNVLGTLKDFPPLVFAGEVRSLRKSLSDVAEGNAFLLQGGDCAESFSEFRADNIRDTIRVILQMAVMLTSGTNMPIVKVGRMAGQFAKPRASPTETKNGEELESYRGDIINGIEFDKSLRRPNPDRMLKAYSQAASTLNLLRAFADGGYADLRYVNSWNMGFLKSGIEYERYRNLANKIQESLNFMEALGVTSNNTPQLTKTEYYTCHEALLLPYEEALTREDSTTGDIYDTSAHFVWIGDRTRFENSAHVEFCSGIKNPIGVKCGPTLDHDELIKILDKLNPNNTPGKVTLICRYGSEKVQDHLPGLIKRISDEGRVVVWSCDPMHRNTVKSSDGTKTRPLENILSEVKNNIKIHNSQGSWFGGIHLEMTGQNVTECTGGIDDISESDLKDRYHTHCDPRLNANQAIQLAFLIADELKNNAG